MKKEIKKAINESWSDYQNASTGMDKNEQWAHEHGWKDGYEWILTELFLCDGLSKETVKKYMDKL